MKHERLAYEGHSAGAWLAASALVVLALGCADAKYEKDVPADAGDAGDAKRISDGQPDAPVTPGVCGPGAIDRSKGKAEACDCDRECQTGFCVDGLCCTSACGEPCKACDLPSSLGDCAFVPAGRIPSDPAECSPSTPSTCGRDGTCDGRGGCRRYVAGTECRPGQCDGDGVTGILSCDGNGQCVQSSSQPCPPYSCDPDTRGCATSCSTADDCAAGRECVGQSCGTRRNGAVCAAASDCASGFCADGVCCAQACTGPCVSCNQTGQTGRCVFVPAGLPDKDCQAAAPSTCGRTGLCDGFGSCGLYPADTVCGPSSCSGLVQNTARTCDGKGTCRSAQLVDCAPFVCTNGACATTCDPTRPDTCEPGHACVSQTRNGVLTWVCGQRKPGQPCTEGGDCESGHCVDGVCCENDCAGACRSCNLPGSPGRCLSVAAGAPDPHGVCQDQGPTACSTNGVCDGNGACQTYPAGTTCGAQSCVEGAYTPPSTCNTSGQCVASRSRTCSPFACNGDVCFTACTGDGQCAPGEFCVDGSCGLKPRGADCTTASDCQSGFCAQGVCCDSACNTSCHACNLTTSPGTCTSVPDRDPDPQGLCQVTPSSTCGMTGLCVRGVCANHEAGINCRSAVCATATMLTPASMCDGQGACVTPPNQSCGTFTCADGACRTGCTSATEAQDCSPPNTCAGNTCGLKVNGAPCTAGNQCQSGFCTEGVCCNTACANAETGGLCKTCKGTLTVPPGTCTNVAAGGADPLSRCLKSSAATGDCSNDGTCDGAGACRPWSTSTGCRPESCVGSTHTLPATCDGAGTCPPPDTVSCGAYVCSGTSPTCLNTCTRDADCTGGLTCLKTNNRCGEKLAAGDSCVADSDCGTGLVCGSEGVCCNSACADGCRSCKLAGKEGTCSNIGAGSPPRATTPVTCPAAAAGACGASGACNGAGGCEQRPGCTAPVTACPADPRQEYTGAGLCSTSGVCGPLTRACNAGYLCAGTACATGCTSGNVATSCDVANGYTCIDGACQKRPPGTSCAEGKECASDHCVDGVCCAASSCPDCQSCNAPGQTPGSCKNVPENSPDGSCVGSCPTATQAEGLCDGAGACKPRSTCAAGYACAGGICETGCTNDTHCAPGYTCASGSCKKAVGQPCGGEAECALGHCVDGICCDVPNCPECRSCNVAGHLGTCYPVGTVADGDCSKSCADAQTSGPCDGEGACRPATPCPGGYACNNATECAVSCTTSCAAGYYCSPQNTCVAKKDNGQGCAAGGECTSGNCVDGVCCSSACNEDCRSCNLTGTEGTCAPVASGSADGTCVAACPLGGNQTSGLCDGAGACRGPSACPGGQLCGAGNQCATSCAGSGCADGFYCSGTECLPLKSDGAACASAGECEHGICISNGTSLICCSRACPDVTCDTNGLCQPSGTGCQTYPAGSTCSAGSAACSADGRASLSGSGTCSGGACQPTPTPCQTGYLCVGTACVGPGGCNATTGCDTANQYHCDTVSGNCLPASEMDGGGA